ncbi:hypothetical protein [Parasitella parasitica]|uniref:Uncharacterized protein n=1 Tax=Parasitella parasitica TaxID=35722 RepID=A0A0B7ND49_9FUNG|nr:hypothetical protein [Parasitella parasitica]
MAPPSLVVAQPGKLHSYAELPSWIQEFNDHIKRQDLLLSQHTVQLAQSTDLVHNRNNQLQGDLDRALARIAELVALPIHTSYSPASAVPGSSSAQPSWARLHTSVSRSTPPTTTSTTAVKQRSAKSKPKFIFDSASRHFVRPSAVHGYQFLYFPNQARIAISELRKRFKAMGLQNSRVLDTHYPTHHNVAALPVHNRYADTFLEAFAKADVNPITDFNSLSPAVLNDPQYTGSSDTESLLSEAKRLHQDRLVKIVLHQFADLYATIKPSSRAPGRTDALMTDATASFMPVTFPLNTSSPAPSPADGLPSTPSA